MRRCHIYLYASVPDFILQNNLAAKIMLFNLPVNNLSYRIEFWLFVDNRVGVIFFSLSSTSEIVTNNFLL
jgi:hypothetical protein